MDLWTSVMDPDVILVSDGHYEQYFIFPFSMNHFHSFPNKSVYPLYSICSSIPLIYINVDFVVKGQKYKLQLNCKFRKKDTRKINFHK